MGKGEYGTGFQYARGYFEMISKWGMALDESIEIWTERAEIGDDDDGEPCPLCAIADSLPDGEKTCHGNCPIAKVTGKRYCYGTPYYDKDGQQRLDDMVGFLTAIRKEDYELARMYVRETNWS
jgi:hypothetical protein